MTIDGREIPFEPGQSILEAALTAGYYIPHLCHHKDLPDIGGCGLCVVEIDGKVCRACLTRAEEGLTVTSNSEKLEHIRSTAIQLMLAGHIDDCNSCPKYLKCEFQMLIQRQGATVGDLRGTARGLAVNLANPLIIRDMDRCVACGRCVRVCHDVRKIAALTYTDDANGRKQVVTKGASLLDSDCRFCGACVEVCPTGALRDQEGVFAEAFCKGDMLVPCSYACPAHIDIPKYIRYLRAGQNTLALETVMERAPLPRSLGNVCMRFCEEKCRRGHIDAPVSVCALKRFAAISAAESLPDLQCLPQNGKTVAVVGAGPCGLSAAWFLQRKGYQVTVFEGMPKAGGMLRYGLPEYRLAEEDLDADIELLLSAGISLECGRKISGREELAGFDAAIWCGGAQAGIRLPIEGASAPGVLSGLEFLRSVRLGSPMPIGKNVLVLGGGDVAYDCARTAIRLGAEAAVCFPEAEDEMKASEHERVDGDAEGVQILPRRCFHRVLFENGSVCGMECGQVKQLSADENGRIQIEEEPGSVHVVECDTVIFAVGQRVEIPETLGIPVDRAGRAMPGLEPAGNIFAAGDAVTGTSSVVEAVAWGQRAAEAADRFLGGDGDVLTPISPPQEKNPDISENDLFRAEGFTGEMTCAAERRSSFGPYIRPLDKEDAVRQSSRCLQCDLRCEISRPRLYSEYAFKREV